MRVETCASPADLLACVLAWNCPLFRDAAVAPNRSCIDQSKLRDKSAFGFSAGENDPAESDKLVKGVVDAKRVDDRHYTITLDLTKTNSSSVNDKVSKLGDKAKAVPGTVTLDDQGRLSEITVDLSAIDPAASVKVTYSDYGTPVTVNPPPKSQTIEAPAAVYGMFNS